MSSPKECGAAYPHAPAPPTPRSKHSRPNVSGLRRLFHTLFDVNISPPSVPSPSSLFPPPFSLLPFPSSLFPFHILCPQTPSHPLAPPSLPHAQLPPLIHLPSAHAHSSLWLMLCTQYVDQIPAADRHSHPWWKAKKWGLHISYRLFHRYSVAKHAKEGNDKAFAERFVADGRRCIGRAWAMYKPCMAHAWDVHALCMGGAWDVQGMRMGGAWAVHALCMGGAWDVHGVRMGGAWAVHGQ
eukprot:358732-Chlamydomonas_euryale.AAC.2